MPPSTLTRISTALASVLLLARCASEGSPPACEPRDTGCPSTGGLAGALGIPRAGAGSGGAAIAGAPAGSGASAAGSSTGGSSTVSGNSSGGSAAAAGASGMGGSSGALAGGAPTAGGSLTGGTTGTAGAASGGAGASVGGSTLTAGSAGMSGASATGGNAAGGATGSSGAAATGGGPVVDQNGIPLAKPGDSKNQSRAYLNLGDMRLIANKWGSDELGCGTNLRVFVNTDKTFGWDIDRGACGGNKQKPDYPEIEFGVHPFGAGNSLATTPSFSSTKLLPIQIKDITSASVVLDSLNMNVQRASTYNLNFEFWLSQRNPTTEADPGVHAELITFFGWQDGWACDKSGNVQAGDRGFNLCHQDDAWAGGKWRYFQFRVNGGSTNGFSGKIDVKALIDWLVSTRNYSRDLWVTRLEVGSEIDDDTKATVTLKNITFEVNGTSKSAQFGQ